MRYSFLKKTPGLEEKKFQEKIIQKKIEREQDYYKKKKKIIQEGRKRNQSYLAINYILGKTTFFKHCSSDLLNILCSSQLMALVFETPLVLTYHLLFSFLKRDTELKKIFLSYGINEKDLFYFIQQIHFRNQEVSVKSIERLKQNLKITWNRCKPFVEFVVDPEKYVLESQDRRKLAQQRLELIDFHSSCYEIFDLTVENTVERFKLCSLTTETLLLTLLEQENCTACLILKRFFDTELDWLIFRFQYLKGVYHREISIRNSLNSAEYYVFTLFQSELYDRELLILEKEKKDFSNLLFEMRKNLILSVLDHKFLKKQICHDISSDTYCDIVKCENQIIRKRQFFDIFQHTQKNFLNGLIPIRGLENLADFSISDLKKSKHIGTFKNFNKALGEIEEEFFQDQENKSETESTQNSFQISAFSSQWHDIVKEFQCCANKTPSEKEVFIQKFENSPIKIGALFDRYI